MKSQASILDLGAIYLSFSSRFQMLKYPALALNPATFGLSQVCHRGQPVL
jgi:hypothetical protein